MMVRRSKQMTNNTDFLTIILYVMLSIMAVLAIALVLIYMNMKVKEKKGFALCIIQKIAGFCEAPVKKPQKKSLPCLLEEFPL